MLVDMFALSAQKRATYPRTYLPPYTLQLSIIIIYLFTLFHLDIERTA